MCVCRVEEVDCYPTTWGNESPSACLCVGVCGSLCRQAYGETLCMPDGSMCGPLWCFHVVSRAKSNGLVIYYGKKTRSGRGAEREKKKRTFGLLLNVEGVWAWMLGRQ